MVSSWVDFEAFGFGRSFFDERVDVLLVDHEVFAAKDDVKRCFDCLKILDNFFMD